jgi:hypothetical protein
MDREEQLHIAEKKNNQQVSKLKDIAMSFEQNEQEHVGAQGVRRTLKQPDHSMSTCPSSNMRLNTVLFTKQRQVLAQ